MKIQLSSLRVVLVIYKRWLLTIASNYCDLIWKLLVFLKTGHLQKVVGYGGDRKGRLNCMAEITLSRSIIAVTCDISMFLFIVQTVQFS